MIITTCINVEFPIIYGETTVEKIINIYNQEFVLQKSIDVAIGKYAITLDDVMEDNIAFVITETIGTVTSGFLKILPICINETINTTC